MIPKPLARPDEAGRFGDYGGRFAPETLMPALSELEEEFESAWNDPAFRPEFERWLADFVGRPTPLQTAERLSAELGVRILLKREDLAHTGAHKINNAVGQALLARRMGKPRVIAETGAGQHGVADCHRGGSSRTGVLGIHGRGRHGTPGAQRAADGAVWGPRSCRSRREPAPSRTR